MKIITIIGARPQFVKAASLSREFLKHNLIEEKIIHTGQHFDTNMSDVFFEEMEIPEPDYHLNIHGLSHGAMTGQMIEGIEKILLIEKPDYVLVYGDTNSTLAGALAARKLNIRVIHVEAGLRSFNMLMPEEINRILTDRISNILFCPTDNSLQNLLNEGFNAFNCVIIKSGDIMQDAAQYYSEKAALKSDILNALKLSGQSFVLATIHRAENTDDPERLYSIIHALNEINKIQKVILPVHPRTKAIIIKKNIKVDFEIIDPVGYFDMIQLIKHCSLICTDSGGLQKEAYFFNKFCITCRDQTEWVELTENGYNIIAGSDSKTIVDAFKFFSDKEFIKSSELYGGGKCANIITDYLISNE